MDPSIMKLLEEDEDETMHSGADVEAFTAALNRDIKGDDSASQPLDDTTALYQESRYTSNQFVTQWKTSNHDENENTRSQQDHIVVTHKEPQSSEMDLTQHGSVLEIQKPSVDSFTSQVDQNVLNVSQAMTLHDSKNVLSHNQGPVKMQNLDHDPKLAKLQNINSQQPSSTGDHSHLAVAMGSNNQQAVPPGGSNQPATNAVSSNLQTSNLMRGKQVPFAVLLPVIQPQLDKDRAMQLNTLYVRLRKNEISKEGFVRHMRSIVGDQMLKMAVFKISQAAKTSQNVPNQLAQQSQAPSQQQLPTSSSVQMVTDSSNQTTDGDAPASRVVEHQSDSNEMQASQMPSSSLILKNQDRNQSSFPLQGINKQQQPPMHFSQPAYPAFGGSGSNYHPHSTTNTNSAAVTAKQQPHDLQMRQIPAHQSIGTAQLGVANQGINVTNIPKFDQKRLHAATHSTNSLAVMQKGGGPSSMNYIKQEPTDQSNEQYKQFPSPHGLSSSSSVHPEQGNAIPETSKDESFDTGFQVPASSIPSNSISSLTKTDSKNSLNSKIPAANSAIALGNNVKAPPKKPSVGQKKPLETLGSPPLPSGKKQKVSGTFLDQSIEQLNDVTAVSGVDLREEEEQLLSGPKEDSRISEASRRVVQEEEERLLLEKIPLQQKLAKIMAKNGIKNMSNDVERCLSLAVEERLRGLICSLIRLSKQREEVEKLRHNTMVITSDVGAKIRSINQKAREELEKKQAQAEKLQRLNEPESNHPAAAVDGGEKDKDESRGGKAPKANKEEDDKMRTTAANVAARAAVGGDDMLSKWQLMAEQAKQKRFGGTADASSSSSSSTSTTAQKVSSSSAARKDDSPEAADKKGGQSASSSSNLGGAVRKVGRNQVNVPQQPAAKAVPSNISLKDLIFVFEREPQMAKSVLLYKLYDRIGNPPE